MRVILYGEAEMAGDAAAGQFDNVFADSQEFDDGQ